MRKLRIRQKKSLIQGQMVELGFWSSSGWLKMLVLVQYYTMFPEILHANNHVVKHSAPALSSISKGKIISAVYLCDLLMGNETASVY